MPRRGGTPAPAAFVLAVALALAAAPGSPAPAAPAPLPAPAGTAAYPAEFPLPDGFRPEGIAVGAAPVAYVGSLADGDLYRADLRTGAGEVFSQGPGTPAVGLKADRRGRLFVSGGSGGDARVVDAATGRVLRTYRLAGDGDTWVNDVVLTRRAAYFTDSRAAVLYKLPLGEHGELPDSATAVPLTGDFHHIPGGINANGVTTTPDGRALLVVQSDTGRLFRVDPHTGAAAAVDLGGYELTDGDGLLREGRRLYAVLNSSDRVAVLELDRAGTRGSLASVITDPRFDVPTTIAARGALLYLPNARFTTEPTPRTPYNAVAVPRP